MVNTLMKKSDENSIFSELKQNDQVLKYLLENAPIGIALIDTDGYYIKVNLNFAQSIGYNIDEVKGMHFSEITCPLFWAADAYKHSKIVSREINTCHIRKQYFKKNGGTLDARVDIYSDYSEETDSLEIIGFYHLYPPFYIRYLPLVHPGIQQLLDTTSSPGILISDADGRVLYGSRFMADFIGLSESEICNQSLTGILDINQAVKLINLLQYKKPVSVFECELKFHHDNGLLYVNSQVFVDNTNYFKNGRILVIIFKDKPETISFNQDNNQQDWEKELFSEVRKIRDSIQTLNEASHKEQSLNSDIRLSDYKLTVREREVLLFFLERKNTKEIAYTMDLAEITVRKHFTSLYRKFGVSGREDLLILLYGKKIS
jgi:PAS domain S-box-containing protein